MTEQETERVSRCVGPKKFVVILESTAEGRNVEHVVCDKHRRALERAPNHVRTEEPRRVV